MTHSPCAATHLSCENGRIAGMGTATVEMILRVLKENWPTDSRIIDDWHPEDARLYREGRWRNDADLRSNAIREQQLRRIAKALVEIDCAVGCSTCDGGCLEHPAICARCRERLDA